MDKVPSPYVASTSGSRPGSAPHDHNWPTSSAATFIQTRFNEMSVNRCQWVVCLCQVDVVVYDSQGNDEENIVFRRTAQGMAYVSRNSDGSAHIVYRWPDLCRSVGARFVADDDTTPPLLTDHSLEFLSAGSPDQWVVADRQATFDVITSQLHKWFLPVYKPTTSIRPRLVFRVVPSQPWGTQAGQVHAPLVLLAAAPAAVAGIGPAAKGNHRPTQGRQPGRKAVDTEKVGDDSSTACQGVFSHTDGEHFGTSAAPALDRALGLGLAKSGKKGCLGAAASCVGPSTHMPAHTTAPNNNGEHEDGGHTNGRWQGWPNDSVDTDMDGDAGMDKQPSNTNADHAQGTGGVALL